MTRVGTWHHHKQIGLSTMTMLVLCISTSTTSSQDLLYPLLPHTRSDWMDGSDPPLNDTPAVQFVTQTSVPFTTLRHSARVLFHPEEDCIIMIKLIFELICVTVGVSFFRPNYFVLSPEHSRIFILELNICIVVKLPL